MIWDYSDTSHDYAFNTPKITPTIPSGAYKACYVCGVSVLGIPTSEYTRKNYAGYVLTFCNECLEYLKHL